MTIDFKGLVHPGMRVLTADGDELGKVKEISGDCFKVDVPMAPDYWLGTDTIAGEGYGGGFGTTGTTETPGMTGSMDTIRLTFTKEELGNEKMAGPENGRNVFDHKDDVKEEWEHKGYHRHL